MMILGNNWLSAWQTVDMGDMGTISFDSVGGGLEGMLLMMISFQLHTKKYGMVYLHQVYLVLHQTTQSVTETHSVV